MTELSRLYLISKSIDFIKYELEDMKSNVDQTKYLDESTKLEMSAYISMVSKHIRKLRTIITEAPE